MGTSANKNGNYVGLLSAVLFIVAAFVMILVKDSSLEAGEITSTAQYVLMGAGILAVIAGIMLVLKEENSIGKFGAVLIAILGIVSLAAYFMISNANMESRLVLEILCVVALIAMFGSIASDRAKGMKGLMDIDIIFSLLEITFLVLIALDKNIEITGAAAVLMIGFWLAATLGLGMTVSASSSKTEVDPNRKSAKRAQKLQAEKDEEAKKKQERQEKLDAHKKAEAKKESKPEQKKEQPKPEPKKEAKVKVEQKAEPKKEAPKEVLKEEKPAEPAPAEKKEEAKPNNDFMAKLVSSKDANKAASKPVEEPVVEEKPAEPEPVVEPVKEEPAPVEEKVVEPEPEVKAEEPAPAEEKVEEPVPEPEPFIEDAPVEEPAAEEPEPVVEEPVVEEPAPVEEPVVEEIPVEETAVEEAPSESEAVVEPVAEAAVAAAVIEEVSDEGSGEESEEEDEVLEDIFTDYSPEALVRRAAWNKGLRCRRDYGDEHIPVAFVKGKVAVYVEDPAQSDTSNDAKLKEDGWVILRYDINTITDGLEQGAEIANAVKANIRAQKASKKKKKPAKK